MGAPLSVLGAICILGPMPDYCKREAQLTSRPFNLMGKDSCPNQPDTARSAGATGGIACSALRGRHNIAIGV